MGIASFSSLLSLPRPAKMLSLDNWSLRGESKWLELGHSGKWWPNEVLGGTGRVVLILDFIHKLPFSSAPD